MSKSLSHLHLFSPLLSKKSNYFFQLRTTMDATFLKKKQPLTQKKPFTQFWELGTREKTFFFLKWFLVSYFCHSEKVFYSCHFLYWRVQQAWNYRFLTGLPRNCKYVPSSSLWTTKQFSSGFHTPLFIFSQGDSSWTQFFYNCFKNHLSFYCLSTLIFLCVFLLVGSCWSTLLQCH